jgi:predicted restriction endonuclease
MALTESEKAYHRERYRRKKAEIRAKVRKWETEHPEKRRVYNKTYRDKYPDKAREWRKKSYEKVGSAPALRAYYKLRLEVLNHYGARCACCGESEIRFLTIDHVNNDGSEHRKTVKTNAIYRWIKKNGYPRTLQVLCHNCNWGKRVNNGVCPHEERIK